MNLGRLHLLLLLLLVVVVVVLVLLVLLVVLLKHTLTSIGRPGTGTPEAIFMSFTSSWLGVRQLTSQRAANSSPNNFRRPPGSTPLASISAAILRSKSVVRSAACEKHAVSRTMGPACNSVTNCHMHKNKYQSTISISSEFMGGS